MDKSPIWDFYKSPKIQLTKSQLDKLAHDDDYIESFLDWMNNILQEAHVAGTTVEFGEVQFPQPNFQPRTDNILSRLVGVSIYDQIAQFFSSARTNYIVQIYDADTVRRVEYLRNDIVPVLNTVLNGSLEESQTTKRLWEANEELKLKNSKLDESVIKGVKELLHLIQKANTQSENVDVAEWLKNYNNLGPGAQIPRKASALIDNFDLRLWRRGKMAKIVTFIKTQLAKDSLDSPSISKQIEELKAELATKSLENFSNPSEVNNEYIFECDAKFPLTLNCVSDLENDTTQLLQDIDLIQKLKGSESKSKDLLYQLMTKLEGIADGQVVVYKNLLQLFQSSKDTTFAQQLKLEHIPTLESLSTSSFLINNWQAIMKMFNLIRLKLDSINPSATKLNEIHNNDDIVEYVQLKAKRNNELDKRCCYNRLGAIFATIENAFGAAFFGQPFQDRLRKIYIDNWKLLQDVVSKNEIDTKVFGEYFISALEDLIENIQSTTEVLHTKINQKIEPVDRLQYLDEGWNTISNAILAYLGMLKDDRWTLPLLLDNHIFQIQKVHSLLPSPSDDLTDTLSKLSFKIYAMQIFFESLLKSAVTVRKNLAVTQSSNLGKNSSTGAIKMLIDEIQYRERSISVPFRTHESYAAAHHVLCELIIRHLTWYFCAGSTDNEEERYIIDFTMYHGSGTDSKITIFDRLPDVSGYVSYMRQFINDSNRDRKTTTFKTDFFKMMYTQILSNCHSIRAGDGSPDIEFRTDLFEIPPVVKMAATSLIHAEDTLEATFKQVRMSSAWKQLISQYEYDRLVETWSIDALTQTDFHQLMDQARAFFNVVQQYYFSIFKTRDNKFVHTSITSLCHNLSISSLANIVKAVVPDWYTEEMCTKIVWDILCDNSARTSRSRGLGKDIKVFWHNLKKAGGVRDKASNKKYVCSSLESIQTWVEEGGSMQAEYRKHLDLMFEKCRLSNAQLTDAVFGDKNAWDQLPIVIRDDLVDEIINQNGSAIQPDDFLYIIVRFLADNYDMEQNSVKRHIENRGLKKNSAALRSTSLYRAILSNSTQAS